ncbi:MAG: hypothetical protein QXX95_05445 [Nitrososphaerales archaeon]
MQRAERKAQATAIGGLLFLIIVMTLVGFQLEFNQAQVEIGISDAERAEERIEISDVFFGQMKTYTNKTTFPPFSWKATVSDGGNPFTDGLKAKSTQGILTPIYNMNFTITATPWVFQRSLINATTGASGSVTTEGTDSLSGAPGIFSDFLNNPPPGQTSLAVMNWTVTFFVDLTQLGNTVSSATLSFGKKVVKYLNVVGPSEEKILFYLRKPSATSDTLLHKIRVTQEDANWVHTNLAIGANNFTQSGFYTLIIQSKAKLSRSSLSTPEFKVLFDDVGIKLVSTVYVADWQATFRIDEPTLIVKKFMTSSITRYNTSDVLQSIYIRDHIAGKWDFLDTSLVGTLPSTKTFKFDLAFGPQLQKYIGTGAQLQNITLRFYSIKSSPYKVFSDGIILKDFFVENRNSLVITLKNFGGKTVTIKSLWISDASKSKRFELNLLLKGGEEMVRVIDFRWSPGDHNFKIITTRGTAALFSSTA